MLGLGAEFNCISEFAQWNLEKLMEMGGWMDGWRDRQVFDKKREGWGEEMKSRPLLDPHIGRVRHHSGTRGLRWKGLNPRMTGV